MIILTYAELRWVSNFPFLRGASQPEELSERAKRVGCAALAIVHERRMAGIVCAWAAAEETSAGSHSMTLTGDGQWVVPAGSRGGRAMSG